jgi:hypothetical protein
MPPDWRRPADAELRAAIEEAFRERGDELQHVARMARSISAYSSSAPIEELTVEMENGDIQDLVFKDASPRARSRAAIKAKPPFVMDPLREIRVYQTLLAPARLGTPEYVGALVDPTRETYWLFVERVAGNPLYEIGEMDIWESASRWLADMHARFASEMGSGPLSSLLLRYEAPYLERFGERARAFIGRSDSISAASRRVLDDILGQFNRVVDRLSVLPATVIHGELYASNVMVGKNGRICPVDWEMAGVGPALLDLAALAAGWHEPERERLARGYYEALPDAELRYGSFNNLLGALAWCRLYVSIQWLGWSDKWIPPLEHENDWVAEALELVELLRLR